MRGYQMVQVLHKECLWKQLLTSLSLASARLATPQDSYKSRLSIPIVAPLRMPTALRTKTRYTSEGCPSTVAGTTERQNQRELPPDFSNTDLANCQLPETDPKKSCQ